LLPESPTSPGLSRVINHRIVASVSRLLFLLLYLAMNKNYNTNTR
jgi:hypothetical protein